MRKQEFFPAEEFDQQYGTQFAKKWILPENHDENSIGKLLGTRKRIYNNLKKIFNQLNELNPELKTIKIKDEDDAWDICYGVVSRFNLDDIKFYVEKWSRNFCSEFGDKHRARFQQVEINNNINFEWVPCPKTLKILKTIKNN